MFFAKKSHCRCSNLRQYFYGFLRGKQIIFLKSIFYIFIKVLEIKVFNTHFRVCSNVFIEKVITSVLRKSKKKPINSFLFYENKTFAFEVQSYTLRKLFFGFSVLEYYDFFAFIRLFLKFHKQFIEIKINS